MILWLNPASGISGDMLLGALLDLGAPLQTVEEAIRSTGVSGWTIQPARVSKGGIGATYANVRVHDEAISRHAWELFDAVSRAANADVASLARKAVHAIAVVEAGIHDSRPEEVHLHEVGGVDTIVDIVGAAAALRELGVEKVYSHPVVVGTGQVQTAHGMLPLPAPATADLLRGARVRGGHASGETVTPTGAAMLKAMSTDYGPLESSEIVRVGYGAGTKDFPGQPNVLQAVLCAPVADGRFSTGLKVMLETNLDDVSGEHLGYLISAALDRGALDAWADQVVGKKGRPAFVLHILCDETRIPTLQAFLFEESGTLGIRVTLVDRVELPRWTTAVEVGGQRIPVKMSQYGGKPERDAVVHAAEAAGLTVREVAASASAAVQSLPRKSSPTLGTSLSPLWAPGKTEDVLHEPKPGHPQDHSHDHERGSLGKTRH